MTQPTFAFQPHATPVEASERAGRIVNPGFGRVFTDHMATMRWSEDKGWFDAKIAARQPIVMDPASAVLHYAQEIFEGLKAYTLDDGGIALFRPEANAARFRRSARRLAMAELPDQYFLDSCRELVLAERDWIPGGEGSALYLRPFMIASETFLGVKPSAEYLYCVIASAVGNYWPGGARSVSLWVSKELTRAAPGGTGDAKCGGNYAASLLAQSEAIRQGCDQVVFLDATERRWVEELGGMNIFFVFADGTMLTPPLTGTILPGVTRDSILTIARDQGITVREERYSIDQWQADAASGRLVEAFACGTAAVVTPIGKVASADFTFQIGDGQPGPRTSQLLKQLTDIQRGRSNDPHGWLQRIA